jgi:DinB superfamily
MSFIRKETLVAEPQSAAHKIGSYRRRRAELLAHRIEEGAAGLAAFAEGLSDAEWRRPMSPTDRRTVGVIVHHVASMYPIEVGLAQAVAGGKAAPEVTWQLVAEINAKHAQEQAGVTKAAALELLRRNSREASAAVRTFTDDELDASAPVGLTFGAPVTAQFIVEDHALRHSWHHLAGIRRALGR